MVVGERILQIGMWSAAVVDVAVAAGGGGGDDGDGAVVVPFLVGLVAQYVLGLSPVSMKLWNYGTTLLLPINDVQLSLLGTSLTQAKSLFFFLLCNSCVRVKKYSCCVINVKKIGLQICSAFRILDSLVQSLLVQKEW
jgi:hypothetical protein